MTLLRLTFLLKNDVYAIYNTHSSIIINNNNNKILSFILCAFRDTQGHRSMKRLR